MENEKEDIIFESKVTPETLQELMSYMNNDEDFKIELTPDMRAHLESELSLAVLLVLESFADEYLEDQLPKLKAL